MNSFVNIQSMLKFKRLNHFKDEDKNTFPMMSDHGNSHNPLQVKGRRENADRTGNVYKMEMVWQGEKLEWNEMAVSG